MRFDHPKHLIVPSLLAGALVALLFYVSTADGAGFGSGTRVLAGSPPEGTPSTVETPSIPLPMPDPYGQPAGTLCEEIPRLVLDDGRRERGCGVVAYQGHGAEWWHWQTVLLERENAVLRRKIATLNTGGLPLRRAADHGLRLAAVVYGVPYRNLRAIAECESGVWPLAKNRSSTASGTLQFLDSTWARTPFGRAGFSVFDPFANALAGAWLMDYDRGRLLDGEHSYREWVCQP